MFWMVDNMPEKQVYREDPERTNARDTGLISETNIKQRDFLKAHCKQLLENMNSAAKKPPIKLEGAGCLMYNDIAEFGSQINGL